MNDEMKDPDQIICGERYRTIREDRLPVAGMPVSYRLLGDQSPKEGYFVEISAGAETGCVFVSEDFVDAAHFYGLVLNGTVTPCTLSYIAEDYFSR